MRILEVTDTQATPKPDQLLGLVEFLAGRATDTDSRKEISQDAFINLAQSLGINVTRANLPQLTMQEPLSNVLEPLQPNSDEPVVYKDGGEAAPAMPVNRAQDIVAKAAKSAARRDRGV